MCTQPLRILNRKFRFLDIDADFKYIKVPCGQCDECLQKRSSQVYVRTRAEYDDCLLNGGIGFMCCLTYGLDKCPTFNFAGRTYRVFNKKHVIDFIKRLRTNLDRFYKKYFGCDAPNFKYLITSEFGSSENGYHLPHYHLIILFRNYIGFGTFRSMFIKSLSVTNKDGSVSSPFGKIFQCDILDPNRGGVKYSAKYVLKDSAYMLTQKQILNIIKFYEDSALVKFHVLPFPQNSDEQFYNKSVRRSKAYRSYISDNVTPYRHMLQFYMVSNDMGASSLVRRYGEAILCLPSLNFEGFAFSIPNLVKKRVRETYGVEGLDKQSKCITRGYIKKVIDYAFSQKFISWNEGALLQDFYDKFVYVHSGRFYLFNPFTDSIDFDKFCFFDDNNFYDYRQQLCNLMSLFENENNLNFRSSVAFRKIREANEKAKKVKQNNSYKYVSI